MYVNGLSQDCHLWFDSNSKSPFSVRKNHILNILNFRYYDIFLRSFQLCFGLCGKWALELVGKTKQTCKSFRLNCVHKQWD